MALERRNPKRGGEREAFQGYVIYFSVQNVQGVQGVPGKLLGPVRVLDARFLYVFWATGHWTTGERVIVFQVLVYMLSLSFLVNVLSLSNQNLASRIQCPSFTYLLWLIKKKNTHLIRAYKVKGLIRLIGLKKPLDAIPNIQRT